MSISSMALTVLLVSVPIARADVIFSGSDPGAGPTDPRPNSNAAAAAYDAAAPGSIITFESTALGAFTNLTIATGVTMNGSDASGDPQTVVNAPVGTPADVYGYNTTAGGSKFVSLLGGSLTFSFATPIDAFGAYLSGVQLAGETITFSDGSSESIGIPNPGIGGGVDFLGFTDFGKSISSVEINVQTSSGGDIVGVDDVRYQTASTSTPEPGSVALLATIFVAIAVCLRMRRKTSVA
jgi:hypothetical protein